MVTIPTAADVWHSQNKDGFEKSINSVVRDIKRASDQGLRSTCFNPYDYRFYDSVKAEFQKQGYYFTPTGYVGGVWQRSENINW